MKHVLFFGDSLTAGYGLNHPKQESLPALIAEMARKENLEFKVTNAGVSGNTTQSALTRLPDILKANIDIFVIGIGANDMLRGYSAETMTCNIELMIQKIRISQPKTKILMLGMELPDWIIHEKASLYRDVYRIVSNKFGLTLLPFLLEGVIGNPKLNLPDLAHPNAKGYELIAARVWPLLRSMLQAE
jgi:acyl-CoA thioesterase-1